MPAGRAVSGPWKGPASRLPGRNTTVPSAMSSVCVRRTWCAPRRVTALRFTRRAYGWNRPMRSGTGPRYPGPPGWPAQWSCRPRSESQFHAAIGRACPRYPPAPSRAQILTIFCVHRWLRSSFCLDSASKRMCIRSCLTVPALAIGDASKSMPVMYARLNVGSWGHKNAITMTYRWKSVHTI